LNQRVLSLYLIFLISSSLPAVASADLMSSAQQENIFGKEKSFKTIENKPVPRHLQIVIAENVGINSNDMAPPHEKIKSATTVGAHKEISLSEQVVMVSNDSDTQSFVIVKRAYDVQAMMDRIWNYDRIRSNGRTLVVDNPLTNDQPVTKLSTIDERPFVYNYYPQNDFGNIFNKLLSVKSTISEISSGINSEVTLFIDTVGLREHDTLRLVDNSAKTENPIIILLLVPLSGYILIKSRGEKLQFFKFKQVLSFCCIVLLLSSIVLTPISISSNYGNKAHAESANSTNSSATTNVNLVPSTAMKATFSDQIGVNDILTSNHRANLTNPVPKSTSDNSTVSESPVINDTVNVISSFHTPNPTLSLSENIFMVDTASGVQPNIAPNATQSWQFGSKNATKNVGDTELVKEQNGTSLQLAGTGYLTQNVNSTRNLAALTLSAWVKPDYSQGSPQFTVISKEDTFLLGVNNILSPAKRAVFTLSLKHI